MAPIPPVARRIGIAPQAGAVAFGTVVATQLAQTLDAGWSEDSLNRSVMGAVGGSTAFLFATLAMRPLRDLLGLALPTPAGWGLIGGGAVAAVALSRLLTATGADWPGSAGGRKATAALPALPALLADPIGSPKADSA